MPGRISRPSTQGSSAGKGPKNKSRKRNLDAYAIASHSTQEKRKTPRHRLGELVEDEPRSKRRRDEDEDGEESDEQELPKRQKRRGPDEDGDVEHGSDSEGHEWTLGGLADDDDDSDLDSDAAFGESDEEKFEGFTFRGSSSNKPAKKKVKKTQEQDLDIDLNEESAEEEDGEEEDDFGEEGVDLATMLDDNDDEVLGGKDEETDEDSGSEEDDEDSESNSDAEMESESDDEATNEERVARLRDRLEGLDEQDTTAPAEAFDTGLSVDDLLADLDPASKAQYAAALKTKKKSAKPTTLTAPLPKRQQDKIDREVASKKAKEQLDRWRDTVIHNRRAEFLTFPLQDPDQGVPKGKEEFIHGGKPQTELEANIQKIMEESGITAKPGYAAEEEAEDALLKAEELATNKLPVEEVLRRRAELRRARELLFREEIKAKRIAKIKSKSYRRVRRKERERQEKKERELLDPEGLGLPLDEDEREKLDRKRAEERMSTKHRDSKWAKSVKVSNRTVWDENARDSVHEQARRKEELKKRIAGQDVHDDDATDVSSDGEFDDDADDQATLNRLSKLHDRHDGEEGIAGMKFMKAADAKRKAQNDEAVEQMRKELRENDSDASSSGDEINDQGLGRAIFGPKGKESVPKPKVKRPELEEGDRSDDEDRQADEQELTVVLDKPKPVKSSKTLSKASGPLAKGAAPEKQSESNDEPGQELSWLAGPGAKKSKKDRQRDRATDNDTLIVTQIGSEKEKSKPKSKAKAEAPNTDAGTTEGWATVPYKDNDDAADSDEEPSNPILTPAEQKAAYHARAFAGDDVQLQFDAEKEAAIAFEDEKEVSNHLPGWGSWAGEGLSKSIRKANAKQKHNPLWKTKLPGGVKAENRQDKNLRNVMISEKQDRKGKKYLAPVLPHEFEKKEQYERSLRVPVGPEWATKDTFQRNTRPRVVVKQGIVAPMDKPLV